MTGADSNSMFPDPPEPLQLVQTAAAAAEAARNERKGLTTGGPLRRALRAFAFRRGRP